MDDALDRDATAEEMGPMDEAAPRRRGAGALGLVQAIGLGLRDTAGDMLRAGREGAAEAYDEMWTRYEAKTKHRRKRKDDED